LDSLAFLTLNFGCYCLSWACSYRTSEAICTGCTWWRLVVAGEPSLGVIVHWVL